MARKLYVFGIGGTGSRVLKALTMLLASGCKLGNKFDVLVPIIIDPDSGNGDLNRTKEMLSLYQEVRLNVEHPKDFFNQEIKTIENLVTKNKEIKGDSFLFQLNGTLGKKFKDYLNYSALSSEDKSFIQLLYSDHNLDANLNVGFKGNPNMGSIVLNQFTSSKDFEKFGQSFGPDDAIFIVNSIFGGTGAAGFPLLLKSLNQGANIPNSAQIKAAPKGGLTVLPYFKLNKGEIDSDTFLEKTKSALDYYNRTIIAENSMKSLYFIADRATNSIYENNAGEQEQKNMAHFVELAGALAVLDFCKDVDQTNGITQIKEFGIEDDALPLTFNSLKLSNAALIKEQLYKFKLFTEYLESGLKRAIDVSRWTKKKTSLNKTYFESPEYKNQIKKFNNHFSEWTKELESNAPAFAPFPKILKANKKEIFKSIDIQNCLNINKIEKNTDKYSHNQLIKLFGESTTKVVSKLKI